MSLAALMPSPPSPDDSFASTRRSLLSRLKHWDDAESWRDFFDTYGGLLHRFALRSGLSETEAQDAVQETLLAVAKQMPEFRYDPTKGSFRAWLYNQARWRIADAFRRRQRAGFAEPLPEGSATGTAEAEQFADPASEKLEAAWDAEWREHQLARALVRVKAQVSARQFQMFHLVAVKGWAMAEITRTLKVNRAQVYVAKLRVSRLVKEELARLDG